MSDQIGSASKDTDPLWAALCESQRLDLIGQVTGSIAHDINNALSVLSGTTELLLEKLAAEVKTPANGQEISQFAETIQKDVQIIMNWSDTTVRVSQRLMEFSQRLRASDDEIDVNVVVTEAVELIRDRCERESIILLEDLDRSIPATKGNGGQVLQVILNLIQNGREAIGARGGDGGSIRVGTSSEENRLLIEVEDDGVGIPEDLREGVFDLTYTTKAGVAGAGLGLAVSRMIARSHGGELNVDGCDTGARLLLELPVKTS